MKNHDLKFFVSILTPFDLKAQIDYIDLSNLVEFYISAGASGFFINDYNGEMYSISEEERIEIAKFVVIKVNKRVPVISSGSFGLTIFDKSELTKKLYNIGIDSVMMLTGHFCNIDDNEDIFLKNIDTLIKLTPNIPLSLEESRIPYLRTISTITQKEILNTGRCNYLKSST